MADGKTLKSNYYTTSKKVVEYVFSCARLSVRGLDTALCTKNSLVTDELERNHALHNSKILMQFQMEKLNIEENLLKIVIEYKHECGLTSTLTNELTRKKIKKVRRLLQRSKRGEKNRQRAAKKAKGFTILMKIHRSKQC